MPSQTITAALKPGQQVPLKTLASLTSSSGSYRISIAPTSLGVPMGTIVNMHLVAFASGAMKSFFFSRVLTRNKAGQPVLAIPSGPAQMAPLTANLALPARCDNRCFCPKGGLPGPLKFKKNLGVHEVIVGALYSRVSGITARFSYKSSQSSSIGVAISAGTKDANFSESGTNSVTSSSDETFRVFHGRTAHNYQTEFRFGLYRFVCEGQPGMPIPGAWVVKSNDFGGGAKTAHLTRSPDAHFCVSQQADSTYHRASTRAWTFSTGASVSDVIGVNLSAQTGYDQETSIAYTVSKQRARKICGLKGLPGGNSPAPKLVVAGAP